MNSLSKIQFLMLGFLFLMLGSLYLNILLVFPAVIFLALQILLSKRDLKRDYPEDWVKYSLIFLVYEVILLALLYAFASLPLAGFGFASIYNLMFVIVILLVITVAVKFVFMRNYCYGTVVFTAKDWLGVSIKGDLFSKITEANYAVENGTKLKLKEGDRVKVRLDDSLAKKKPNRAVELMK